jgi:hypothetical protein
VGATRTRRSDERPDPLCPREPDGGTVRREHPQARGGRVFPADGLDYHVCFGDEGSLRVSEIWDSQEQLDAFGERLMPILAEVGIEPGTPEMMAIHNIVKR